MWFALGPALIVRVEVTELKECLFKTTGGHREIQVGAGVKGKSHDVTNE